MTEALPLHRRSAEVGHEADGASRGVLAELVHAARWDEKDRTGSDGVRIAPDPLLAVPAEVKEQLTVRMPVRGKSVERLEVAVDPQRTDRPIATAQVEASQNDRLNGGRGWLAHQHNK